MARADLPRTLAEFQDRLASEEDCRRHLVACRWPDGFRCPRCGGGDACELATRELLRCGSRRHQASVTAGTVLHRTRVPLRLWFAAAYLVTTHTPGFSAVQLQRQLGLDEFVFRFNRRRTPMAAFRSLLGLSMQHPPTTYQPAFPRCGDLQLTV